MYSVYYKLYTLHSSQFCTIILYYSSVMSFSFNSAFDLVCVWYYKNEKWIILYYYIL